MGCFKKVWTPLRDTVESGASLAGNYLLPGSSLLTNNLVSKGSQEQLGSTLGKLAQIGTGLAGSGVGSATTGIPSASSIGAGWTNAANGLGGLVGAGDVGTNISNGISGLLSGGESGTSSGGGLFSGLFGGGSPSVASDGLNVGQAYSGTAAENAFLNSAKGAAGLGQGSTLSGLGSALSAGTGGGSSSYGGIGTLASLGGAANSLYANQQAQKDLLTAQKNSMNVLQPFVDSGTAANTKLSGLLGTGGDTSAADYGSLNTPFTAEDLQNDPGYQFQLQQGNQALDRKSAAGGNYFSGSALKAAQDYGQGLADTTYNTAFARDQAQKAQTYGMFAGQSGAGQSAANSAGDIYQGTGNAQANAGISSANIINQSLSSLLNGSGARKPIYNNSGQIIGYA